MSIKKKDVQDR